MRSAYAQVLALGDGAREGLDCRRARLELWLGAYAEAAQTLERLARVVGAPCDVSSMAGEGRELSSLPRDEARALRTRQEAERLGRERRHEAAKRAFLEAWQLSHPNGAWLLAAGSEAALAGTSSEARALFDRGMSELERETGASFRAALPTNLARFSAVEWSPDGALLAFAADHSLVLVDSASLQDRFVLPLVCDDLDWTRESGLICGHADGRVLRVDPKGASHVLLTKLPGPVLRVSASGTAVAAVGGGRAVIIDARGSWEAESTSASAIALSHDGTFAVIGSSDGSIYRARLANHGVELLGRRELRGPAIERVRISADDRWMAASLAGEPTRLFELNRPKTARSLPFIGHFRFTPDSTALLTSADAFALEEHRAPRSAGTQPYASSAFALSPDGARIVEQSATAISVRSRTEPRTFADRLTVELEGGWWISINELREASEHAGHFAASGPRDPTPALSECRDATGLRSESTGELLCAAADLRLTPAGDSKPRWVVPLPHAPVGHLEFTESRARVLVGGPRMQASLVDTRDGSTVLELHLLELDFTQGEFSSTGSAIDAHGNVELWGDRAAEVSSRMRCAIGAYRFDFDVCRDERLHHGLLLGELGKSASARFQK